MKYYIEITLLPSIEIGQYFLWEKAYQKIHSGLSSIEKIEGEISIGVAFPEYDVEKCRLGGKLRLFAMDQKVLESFNAKNWMNGLRDYVHITKIREVPDNITQYACFQRKQVKSSIERLARRKSKRDKITHEQALAKLAKVQIKSLDEPFIRLISNSSKQHFRLFIGKKLVGKASHGKFSSYGLSNIATVPDF